MLDCKTGRSGRDRPARRVRWGVAQPRGGSGGQRTSDPRRGHHDRHARRHPARLRNGLRGSPGRGPPGQPAEDAAGRARRRLLRRVRASSRPDALGLPGRRERGAHEVRGDPSDGGGHVPGPDRARVHARRRGAHPRRGQARGRDRHRERVRDRQGPLAPLPLLRPGCAVHDARPHGPQRHRGLGQSPGRPRRRAPGARRPEPVRRAGGSGDEQAGHDGRRLARLEAGCAGRHTRLPRARDRLALGRVRVGPEPPEPGRRNPPGTRGERGRRPGRRVRRDTSRCSPPSAPRP